MGTQPPHPKFHTFGLWEPDNRQIGVPDPPKIGSDAIGF